MAQCSSCLKQIDGPVCPHCGYPRDPQNQEHQLPVGTMLHKRYQIGRVLGQGGFGITYLAWDDLLMRKVAIKEFFPSGTVFRDSAVSTQVRCGSGSMVPHYAYSKERFLREARALVRFQDIPEIVNILDFVEENNTAYIVMEFVRGVDLAKYIQRSGGKLSVSETFRILKPVMEALAKVHKGGIVHRDISPDNIILDPMGGAKLLDFGAVRSVDNPGVDKALTHSTEAILKHGFAPMEQYNSRGTLGPWTDEYAMCATAWYCFTGNTPPEAPLRMTEGIDPDWSSIPGLPEYQQKALEKGFNLRPRDRYPDLDSLIEALFPAGAEAPKPVTASIPERKPEPAAPAPVKTELAEEIPAAPQPVAAEAPKAVPPAPVAMDNKTVNADASPSYAAAQPSAMDNKTVYADAAPDYTPVQPSAMDNKTVYANASPAYVPPKAEPVMADAPQESAPTERKAPSFIRKKPVWIAALLAIVLLAAIIVIPRLSGSPYKTAENWNFFNPQSISTGLNYTVGLKANGTVVAVGKNNYGECDVSEWEDIVSISAGWEHTVGLKADGTVIAAGRNNRGQCDVSRWQDIVTISAGYDHTVGLKTDGTVVSVGANDDGQCDVSGWRDIVAISAGYKYTVGLKADGTVVAVGENSYGKCNVSGWQNIVAISAGSYHTIGLKADGTVVAVGENSYGRCNVSGWLDIVAISASNTHTVGLKSDGTVVAVGACIYGSIQSDMSGWQDIVAISAGSDYTVGLKANGTVVAAGRNDEGQYDVSEWRHIRIYK